MPSHNPTLIFIWSSVLCFLIYFGIIGGHLTLLSPIDDLPAWIPGALLIGGALFGFAALLYMVFS